MTARSSTLDLPRPRNGRGSRVTNYELFFDRVDVFAVTQISHLPRANLTERGAIQSLIILLAAWWAWMDTAWAINWLDPNRAPLRLMLVGVILGSVVIAAVAVWDGRFDRHDAANERH